MKPVSTITSPGVPLLTDNIDTDTIIPSREMRSTGRTGLAGGLFAPWRYTDADKRINDPSFVLNQRDAIGTRLLLGGTFGLEGFDVLLFSIIAVVVFFIDQATITHPAIGGDGLGVVVFGFFDHFRQCQLAGGLQIGGRHAAGIEALHTHHAPILAQALVQLAVANIDTNHLYRPLLEQAIGKAAGTLAYIEAAQAAHL